MEEASNGKPNLKDWQSSVQKRTRVFVRDAQSVYDYLTKEGSGLSRDKRMAIEGALLKEALRQPNAHLRWIDGLQNIADILTKEGADLEYFRSFLRTGTFSLVQDPTAAKIKERKRAQRASRREKQVVDKSGAQQQRRLQAAASLQRTDKESEDSDLEHEQGHFVRYGSEATKKNNECEISQKPVHVAIFASSRSHMSYHPILLCLPVPALSRLPLPFSSQAGLERDRPPVPPASAGQLLGL
jgi:hypothetical protein